MADMHDCGRHTFESWSKVGAPREGAHMNISEFYSQWLGPFDPAMTAEKADEILNGDLITQSGKDAFRRGWRAAQQAYQNAQT